MNLSDQMSRVIVASSFSRWSTLCLAGVMAFVLLVFGLSPSSFRFWIILSAIVVPFVLLDASLYLYFARREKSYTDVRREAGRLTLEEVRRRREAKRNVG